MPDHDSFHKPRVKPAVPPVAAVLATAGILGPLLALRLGAIPQERADVVVLVLIATAICLASVTRQFNRRNPEEVEPSSLKIDEARLRQYDSAGNQTAEVDLSLPFEYRILGPTNQPNPEILLFQNGTVLRFFKSDTGATEVIRDCLQIPWPRRPRVFMSRTP